MPVLCGSNLIKIRALIRSHICYTKISQRPTENCVEALANQMTASSSTSVNPHPPNLQIRWQDKGIQAHALFQGEIIAKIHWRYLKNFFSSTTGPISTKPDTSILGWRRCKFLQMKGHTLFQGEIIVKIHWQNLIIFFYITNGPINFNQTCNWHKAFLGEGDLNLFKWRATSIAKGR